MNIGPVSCDVRLAGATRTLHETRAEGDRRTGGLDETMGRRCNTDPSFYQVIDTVKGLAWWYSRSLEQIHHEMEAVLDLARADRPYLSHLTINGADEDENGQLFHTLRQHFRKLQKQGKIIAWFKCHSFDDHGHGHIHLALFHDIPLSALLSRRRRTGTGAGFDLPRFKCRSDRLRPVFHNGRWVFRSYNYKVHITPHDNAGALVDYFLQPSNFQPYRLLEHRRQWLTTSRNISTAGGIHEVLRELFGICKECQVLVQVLGMESLEKSLFRSIAHDIADLLEGLAAGGFVVGAATTRDSDCNTDRNDIADSNDISDINDSAGRNNGAFDRKDIADRKGITDGNDTADVKTDTQENGNDPSTHPPTRDLGRAADSDTSSIHNAGNDNATACHVMVGYHTDKRTSPPWMIRPP